MDPKNWIDWRKPKKLTVAAAAGAAVCLAPAATLACKRAAYHWDDRCEDVGDGIGYLAGMVGTSTATNAFVDQITGVEYSVPHDDASPYLWSLSLPPEGQKS